MFLLSHYLLWNLTFFFFTSYAILLTSIVLFTLPSIDTIINSTKLKNLNPFLYITGFDIYWILLTPLLLIFFTNFFWCGPSVSSWFGHLIFTSFQNKIFYLIIFLFYTILFIYTNIFYFSSKEIFDYLLTNFNFLYWIIYLFFANSLFTVIFFIEILSTLIFLLIITSTFSTSYFYNNLNLNLHNYFNNTTPFFFIQMLLSFFWISLIASLNFFLSIILFYLKFLTFDSFLFEFLFLYIIAISSLKEIFFILFIWLNFLFCIFLKCGLVPFYFWKPIFFKGIPIHALFFYINFFYFFIFLFIIYLLLVYLNEIFFFFLNINILLLLFGFLILLSILCETYYLKTFLAISSILNTLFVFLALNNLSLTDFFF